MEAVGQIRGYSTRGRMGMGEIPLLLQVTHGVSDRGRGYPQATQPGHRAASGRLCRFHVCLDYGLQNADFPFREVLPDWFQIPVLSIMVMKDRRRLGGSVNPPPSG